MLRFLRTQPLHGLRSPLGSCQIRGVAAVASGMDHMGAMAKREGDISDSFASLSGKKADPLPDRFRQLKLQLVRGHEDAIIEGWKRLLDVLRRENELIARRGPAIVPEVRFDRLDEDLRDNAAEIKKRGVAVVRGVIPEDEARAYKFEIEEYVRRNPQTRGASPKLFD
jgi:Asp-tRNA(Asn)/Glu-tRNA(Gln) amidotransferase A subunit family amidase